ncbi:MAG TPA: ABC transporter permease [Streptosporangiaceae bacterium]
MERDALRNRLRPAQFKPALRWETGLVVVVIAIVIFGNAVSPQFLTSNNFFNLGLTTGEIAIMALPMALIIISGEIDLSVESMLGMSSALLGVLYLHKLPILLIFLIVAVVGALGGLLNGLLVTRVGLPSLAVTIGTLALYRGIALILLGPRTVANFPTTYTNVGIEAIPHTDLPWSIGIFIVLAVIFAIVLHATPFGRSVYAMGDNAEAASFAGIRVKRIKTSLFVISGLASALAGVLWTFRLNTAVQDNGTGLSLDVVAIVLLAGVSIFGGKGSIAGVFLAVLAFAGLQNALLLTNFNQEATGLVTGGLLLVSVFVPNAAMFVRYLRGVVSRSAPRPPEPALSMPRKDT